MSSADSLGSLGHLVVDVDTMSDASPPLVLLQEEDEFSLPPSDEEEGAVFQE